MHVNDELWLWNTYDRIVASGEDATMKFGDARVAVIDEVEAALQSGELKIDDYRTIATLLVDQEIKIGRKARRARLADEMEWIIAALADETTLGVEDPILAQAFPLGDGRDKILMFWSADDWRNATLIRYRKASEATGSAAIFDELAAKIIAAMQSRRANKVADLFRAPKSVAS